MLGAIFLLAFAATSSRAQMVEVPVNAECRDVNGVSMCLLKEKELDDILAQNNKAWWLLAEAVKRIQALEKKAPKCAELEVVPPKKK